MSNLRRYKNDGNLYFITCVTYKRERILINNVDLLKKAVNSVIQKTKFNIIAQVLLPEHFHIIIDPYKNDISNIIQRLKMSFGMLYLKKRNLKSGRVWQNRFWDHIIRNQEDMNKHIDYIHYNPVKHKIVKSPFDWKYTSIHKYKEYYADDWGVIDEIKIDGNFGE